MNQICYITRTKRGFKPCVAETIESEGDDDSFLNTLGTMPVVETIKEAQQLVIDNAPLGATVYIEPVHFSNMQIMWLSEIKAVNQSTNQK